MLVIGHTVPAIYALGHNGVENDKQNDTWISTALTLISFAALKWDDHL